MTEQKSLDQLGYYHHILNDSSLTYGYDGADWIIGRRAEPSGEIFGTW